MGKGLIPDASAKDLSFSRKQKTEGIGLICQCPLIFMLSGLQPL